MNDRSAEAEMVLTRLHKNKDDPNHSFARKEMSIMKMQIDLESRNRLTVAEAFKNAAMRRRFITGWLAMSGTQASGLIVVLSKILFSIGFGLPLPRMRSSV
jgi:hypothetical protein